MWAIWQPGHWKDDNDCSAKVKARALDEGVCVTPETVEGTKEDLGTATLWICRRSSCVSLLHIFGPENFTCVADVCSYVPNLGCGDTHLRTGDTCAAECAPGIVLGVGDTEQTFSCQPDGVVSGTQPVCQPLPCSAPKADSGYGVDVEIDQADERSA